MSEPSRGARGRRTVAPRGPGRRSVVDRAQRIQDEAERTSAREAEYAAQQTEKRLAEEKAARAKNRAQQNRRGRGGYMGDTTQIRSGPLSSAAPLPGAKKARGQISGGTRTGEAKAFGEVKREGDEIVSSAGGRSGGPSSGSGSGGGGGGRGGGGGGGGNLAGGSTSRIRYDRISDDDDYESDESGGPRVDVDYINLISDEEGGSDTSQAPQSKFVPVRVDRIPHRDRAPQINPDASSTIKKQEDESMQVLDVPPTTNQRGKQRSRDVEIIETSRPWKGAYEDDKMLRYVKEEEGDHVPISSLAAPIDPAAGLQPQVIDTQTPITTRSREPKIPVFQTEEDEREWERHNNDLKTMVDELGMIDLKPPPVEGEAPEMTQDLALDKKADRVYLFQFPPVVPDLSDVNEMDVDHTTEADKKINKRGPGETTSEDINQGKDQEKKKPVEEGKRPDHLPNLATGNVGKLRVYKSGKATLDWGGTSLQLNMGVNPFFLQDSVMVKMDQEAAARAGAAAASSSNADTGSGAASSGPSKQTNQITGDAMAFGQIRGKFVVTPDWDEVLGKF